ncbi:uncharacterized protein LOC127443849 isoform X3 [Myxocyprinus asiaticus]|uniref:uncharacterized protein LOC127443849 isoform X3 n=1 Tax=Myxocyprinus asiaticus TaxID=70543 RepID=UPI002223DAC1|nr:uncharacterized protein LOC127443849 isoform X3 [Myxocyprinus asiaticus]
MAQHLKWILLSVFVQFVSGQDEKKAVGGDITFYPESIPSPTKSIIWKHRDTAGTVVKAIEWNNEDGVEVLNPKFKGITTLDITSGGLIITNLKVEHSGVYAIEINSKEQAKKFPLTVIERVPKPKIRREPTSNRDVMYLICEGDARIIWKNSTGETLSGTPISGPPKGESLTVKNTHNRDNYYTCTLKNEVSEETSDPDYEKDLFAERVPKPKIRREPTGNRDVMYLICEGDARIIWKNSTGETLSGTPISGPPKGESLTVKNTHNRDNYYTCTLKNEVSEETSDPDYEKDLFAGPTPHIGLILGIVFGLIFVGTALPSLVYIFHKKFHDSVQQSCGSTLVLGGVLSCLDSCRKKIGAGKYTNPNDPEH